MAYGSILGTVMPTGVAILHVDCDRNFECSSHSRDDVFVYEEQGRTDGTRGRHVRGELRSQWRHLAVLACLAVRFRHQVKTFDEQIKIPSWI